MRTLRLLLIVLLVLTPPTLAFAQTTNSRTQDGDGNRIQSTTTTPSAGMRGFVSYPVITGTQPITATTLPLPSGAATLSAVQDIEAAIREAQGIGAVSPFLVKGAGAVVAESIAVRCVNAGGTAFESCAGAGGGSSGTEYDEDTAHVSGDKLTMVGVVRQDTATALSGTSGDRTVLITDASGRLWANVGTSVLPTGAATEASLVKLPLTQGSTTSGQSGVLIQAAVTTSAPTYTTAQTSPLSLQTDGSLRTAITNTVTVASHAVTNAGTFATQSSQAGTWTVQPGNTPNTTPWLVQSIPGASGGGSTCYVTSAASTNSTNCKSAAGQVYHISAINTTGVLYYLRMYNLASAPTCSSATGFIESLPVPASTTGSGFQRGMVSGQAYSTGVGFCLTGGGSSTDNTNAATGVFLSVIFK